MSQWINLYKCSQERVISCIDLYKCSRERVVSCIDLYVRLHVRE